jgi:acid phosphatase family membrane protein YuiD
MQFRDFLIFLLPLVIAITTPIVKFIIYSLKHGWSFKNTFIAVSHGHMPSSHTAFVASAVTSIGYYEGINSGSFAVALILAIIVIDDSVRLRIYMGDHGRYLNMLLQRFSVDESEFPRLKERVGHRISEVIVGGIFGCTLTLLLAYYL